jgi:hypothetical protein
LDLLTTIANEFEIPIIGKNQKVWFFRTKAGRFYYDFKINEFIGIGWDLISPDFIRNTAINKDGKKEKIELLYPDEKRPGLILGQMDTFYHCMKVDDLVVIPSSGGKSIAIGKLGDFVENVEHKVGEEEYDQCNFLHKRKVKWIKEVDSWQDIYLFKALRAQQTISDITEDSKLLLRNLYPVYISEDAVHITLQKATNADLNMASYVDFQAGILDIAEATSKLYGTKSFRKDIRIKTAVGSPGFIETIFPNSPIAGIAAVFVLTIFTGVQKASDGSFSTGVMAIVAKVNDLINDHTNRKQIQASIAKTEAETQLILAQAEVEKAKADQTKAQTELTKSQIAETNARTRKMELENQQIAIDFESGKTTEELREEQEQLTVAAGEDLESQTVIIAEKCSTVFTAARDNGITYNERKIS